MLVEAKQASWDVFASVVMNNLAVSGRLGRQKGRSLYCMRAVYGDPYAGVLVFLVVGMLLSECVSKRRQGRDCLQVTHEAGNCKT